MTTHYQVSVTITPLVGGWEPDAHERLVGTIGIEAGSYSEALAQLGKAIPLMNGNVPTSNINPRAGR